jgi:hypothetical protein
LAKGEDEVVTLAEVRRVVSRLNPKTGEWEEVENTSTSRHDA